MFDLHLGVKRGDILEALTVAAPHDWSLPTEKWFVLQESCGTYWSKAAVIVVVVIVVIVIVVVGIVIIAIMIMIMITTIIITISTITIIANPPLFFINHQGRFHKVHKKSILVLEGFPHLVNFSSRLLTIIVVVLIVVVVVVIVIIVIVASPRQLLLEVPHHYLQFSDPVILLTAATR